LQQQGEIITTYAKDFTNLYSLWALVSLNFDQLPDAKTFAKKYTSFMKKVNKFRDERYLESVIKGGRKAYSQEAFKYYQNTRGASTDARQRKERNNALYSAIFE